MGTAHSDQNFTVGIVILHFFQWVRILGLFIQWGGGPTGSVKQGCTLEAFKKGYFTVKRSNRTFSNIGIDQAHEQNNKLVKIHGEAIGIFDNQNAPLRWSVSTSIIAGMCNEDKEDDLSVKHQKAKQKMDSVVADRKLFSRLFNA